MKSRKLKHVIIITENVIEDIEKITLLPDDYKPIIKSLLLSYDNYSITLAKEIIENINKSDMELIFIKDYADIIGNKTLYDIKVLGNGNLILNPK